jgi:hypothetical protein
MRHRFNRPSRNTPFSETLGATGLFRIMRLTESERQAIREIVGELTGGARAIIFGSRIYESATGGDIDLLVESSEPKATAGAQERKTA